MQRTVEAVGGCLGVVAEEDRDPFVWVRRDGNSRPLPDVAVSLVDGKITIQVLADTEVRLTTREQK